MKPGLGVTIGCSALVAALLAATGPTVAQAQVRPPQAGTTQQFQDWRRECRPPSAGEPETCVIRQIVFNKETNKGMLAVTIGYLGAKHEPAALFDLPLGLLLPPGVVLTVPGTQPVRVVIQTCLPQGCRAAMALAADVLAALKKADSAKVTVESTERQKLSAPISLKGFAKAFASLNKK